VKRRWATMWCSSNSTARAAPPPNFITPWQGERTRNVESTHRQRRAGPCTGTTPLPVKMRREE
jgi:hypothetical protein